MVYNHSSSQNYILGHAVEIFRTSEEESEELPSRHLTFKVGDQVKVVMEVETLKLMQKDHGGWNDKMSEVSGKKSLQYNKLLRVVR